MPSKPANYLYRAGNIGQRRPAEILALQRVMVRKG